MILILWNRYDRDFLLQFMSICRDRPDVLSPLDAIGLEPCGGSGCYGHTPAIPLPSSRAASIDLGIRVPNPFSRGNFVTP